MPIYPSGSIINNRYEVVQGPHEKPSLAGGMGLVYLCVDHGEGGRPVALKTFRPEYLPNREARDRFLREGTTWVELDYHPHIVRCYEVIKGVVGAEVFFVLELVAAAEGKRDASLRSWLIPGKPLPVEQALLFALHLARGMKHATEKLPGLVHRDLKPENVLVGRDGLARITDFGLAKALASDTRAEGESVSVENDSSERQRNLLTHGIAGTPHYMSPEQWAGETLDARSDIYAYGCILYEMITGKRVVTGETLSQIEKAHREGQVAKISSTLSNNLSQLVERCVKMNREERYGGWLELKSEVSGTWKSVMGKEKPPPIDRSQDIHADRVAVGWSYNNIGLSYSDIGKFLMARDYFEKALAIGRQEGEYFLKAAALGNLGNAYADLGDARGAIGYLEQHLAIARETDDRQGEGATLGNLGIAYLKLGKMRRAIEHYEQHLAIARETGDRQGEGQALGNLGNAYFQLGETRSAIGYHEQHLAIARETDDRQGEGATLGNLGNAYFQLGETRSAIGYFEQCLAIARELGDRQGEGTALGNLGSAYAELGDAHRAIEYYEQDLAIAREIGDRQGEGQTLGNLGNAYLQSGDARMAIGYYERSLAIMREVGDVMNEALFSLNLSILYYQQNSFREAQPHAQYALQVFTRAGHSQYAALARQLLQQIEQQINRV